jgi:aspartate--ammonia ligase
MKKHFAHNLAFIHTYYNIDIDKMSQLIIPKKYHAALNLKQTEQAIKRIKDFFLSGLSSELRLRRVTAPLFVLRGLGMNDDLNGVERAVNFPIKDMDEARAEVVHSLAKWKRVTLAEYQIGKGFGIITDMNAIRADEELDNLHSLYVDQWDWERVIREEDRNIKFLKKIVEKIYSAILRTEFMICETYPSIKPFLPEDVFFIHSEQLRQLYPNLTPKEREDAICREHGAVFIMGIGAKLGDGKEHDLRAPDYDDWTSVNEDGFQGLNGDLLVWYPILNRSIELSSMGIRVDREALLRQLKMTGKEERTQLYFHKRLLEGSLPLSIGGGIGQSRLCLVLLHKAHIGETQSSIWPEDMRQQCKDAGITLI